MLPQIISILFLTLGTIVTLHFSNEIAVFNYGRHIFAADQLFHTKLLQNFSMYHLELMICCFLNYRFVPALLLTHLDYQKRASPSRYCSDILCAEE